MDDSQTAKLIAELAIPQIDLSRLVKSDLTISDAEELGRKLGLFYQGLYKGVLSGLAEARRLVETEVEEVKLDDTLHPKGRTGASTGPTRRISPRLKQSRLNDVVLFKETPSRKKWL